MVCGSGPRDADILQGGLVHAIMQCTSVAYPEQHTSTTLPGPSICGQSNPTYNPLPSLPVYRRAFYLPPQLRSLPTRPLFVCLVDLRCLAADDLDIEAQKRKVWDLLEGSSSSLTVVIQRGLPRGGRVGVLPVD